MANIKLNRFYKRVEEIRNLNGYDEDIAIAKINVMFDEVYDLGNAYALETTYLKK